MSRSLNTLAAPRLRPESHFEKVEKISLVARQYDDEVWEDWVTVAALDGSEYITGCLRFHALTKVVTGDVGKMWAD